MSERRRNLRGFAAARAALACALVASVGCTMCPDPFDYSGPVPNGSPPQNDFRARSGGILPLGSAPRPWPTIVESEGDATPSADGDPRSILVADRRSGVDPVIDPETDAAIDTATDPEADPVADPVPDVLGEIPAETSEEPALEVPDPEAGLVVGGEVAPAPEDFGEQSDAAAAPVVANPVSGARTAVEKLFQARETPGWRPRR
ncbi:MAG: hypothetical protein ACKOTB_01280 [Planctomycetia bacterium]